MKIEVNRESLEKKLILAVSIMPSKSMIPILDEALIQVTENTMLITTSDNEITMLTKITCETSGDIHDFVCDLKTIFRTIALLKSEIIVLDISDDTLAISTKKTRKKFEVPIIYKPDAFPLTSADKWHKPITVSGTIFSKMIKQASLFVNVNTLRRGMAGINLRIEDDTLVVESATENLICKTSLKFDDKVESYPAAIIPKNIAKVTPSYDKSPKIEISLDDNDGKESQNIMIKDGSTTIFVKLLDGNFPDISPFINVYTPDINMKINREELSMSIKRLSVFTDNINNAILFDMQGDNIVLKGEDTGYRKKAEELIEVDSKSDKMNFIAGFNHSYLSIVISSLFGENVFMSQMGYKQMGYITDDSSVGFDTLWIVAPVVFNHKPGDSKLVDGHVEIKS